MGAFLDMLNSLRPGWIFRKEVAPVTPTASIADHELNIRKYDEHAPQDVQLLPASSTTPDRIRVPYGSIVDITVAYPCRWLVEKYQGGTKLPGSRVVDLAKGAQVRITNEALGPSPSTDTNKFTVTTQQAA